MDIKYKLCDNGKTPCKAHKHDACFDCYSAENVEIYPTETKLVKLGFCMELPTGYEAQIRPRSGLSKKGIFVQFGTVDENYRGEVMACVYNASHDVFKVEFGDRICQMAIAPIPYVNFMEVESLSDSERGEKGFGSSGLK